MQEPRARCPCFLPARWKDRSSTTPLLESQARAGLWGGQRNLQTIPRACRAEAKTWGPTHRELKSWQELPRDRRWTFVPRGAFPIGASPLHARQLAHQASVLKLRLERRPESGPPAAFPLECQRRADGLSTFPYLPGLLPESRVRQPSRIVCYSLLPDQSIKWSGLAKAAARESSASTWFCPNPFHPAPG